MDNKRYYTLDRAFKERYGKKVFKVPLNGDFTCPNRDGVKAYGGCTFCSPSGGADFNAPASLPLAEQYRRVVEMLEKKWPDACTIPYFQANTNTYAPIGALKKLYDEALSLDKRIVGLHVATRCDALDEEKASLLATYAAQTDLTVELGLQTINEQTARRINRGHDLSCVEQAVGMLKSRGIPTVLHLINSLPGDTREDMLRAAEYVNALDVEGVKIHMLHVMENTPIADSYRAGEFDLLDLDSYVEVVIAQLERLHRDIVIHRLTGDAPRETLIAPQWTAKKFVVLNEIDKRMRQLDTYQGRLAP